jgi:hypothetical protein
VRVFVYGTLLDARVRRLVTGRPLALALATLRGFEVRRALGRRFPILVRRRAGRVRGGLIAVDPGPALDRLNAFESGYDLRPVAVNACGHAVLAQVFLPQGSRLKPVREAWRLGAWRACDRADFLFQIRKGLPSSQSAII